MKIIVLSHLTEFKHLGITRILIKFLKIFIKIMVVSGGGVGGVWGVGCGGGGGKSRISKIY